MPAAGPAPARRLSKKATSQQRLQEHGLITNFKRSLVSVQPPPKSVQPKSSKYDMAASNSRYRAHQLATDPEAFKASRRAANERYRSRSSAAKVLLSLQQPSSSAAQAADPSFHLNIPNLPNGESEDSDRDAADLFMQFKGSRKGGGKSKKLFHRVGDVHDAGRSDTLKMFYHSDRLVFC